MCCDVHLHRHLVSEEPATLRPTQMTVGLAEVAIKRGEWAASNKKERREVLLQVVFPAVLRIKACNSTIDHHPLGPALIEERLPQVWIALHDNLSRLTPEVFWRVRRDWREIPRRLTPLRDVPYRSLAKRVHEACGYSKTAPLYAEFLWADFSRSNISATKGPRRAPLAVRTGRKRAKSAAARYLPGWAGRAP